MPDCYNERNEPYTSTPKSRKQIRKLYIFKSAAIHTGMLLRKRGQAEKNFGEFHE